MVLLVDSSEMRSHDVSRTRGFLPSKDPIDHVERYGYVTHLAQHIPQLLTRGDFRREANKLKLYDDFSLLTSQQKSALFRDYSFLANAYLHSLTEGPTQTLPPTIAVPLYRLASTHGRPPILSYASYCLENFRLPDPHGPVTLENLSTLRSFTEFPDEPWFILVHTEIEAKAGNPLSLIGSAQRAVVDSNTDALRQCLLQMKGGIDDLTTTLSRMQERNSPEIYHGGFRPYIQKFDNVVYEGVEVLGNAPHSFRGETGAQSSILPTFDAAFRINHEPTNLTEHNAAMRNYMPRPHRRFIQLVEAGPSIREYVKSAKNEALRYAYNGCCEAVADFRDMHGKTAELYITKKTGDPTGTGGTPFPQWLAQLAKETRDARL